LPWSSRLYDHRRRSGLLGRSPGSHEQARESQSTEKRVKLQLA
jgi:hypothetical protein